VTQPDLGALLHERRTSAERTLREAIRIDFSRFLDSEVEARLLARPHFRDRFPPQALVQLRRELDSVGDDLTEVALGQLADLRAWFGAQPAEEADEAAALERVLEPLESAAEELLRTYGFPDDEGPDEPGAAAPLDLDATYTLDYRPSANVIWAWRRLRAIDTARNELVDADGVPPEPSFELVFHLPEALPPDTSKPPTID
jgi:hypothetical protein